MGYHITRFEAVGSTNDIALEAASAGAKPGLVVRATRQVRGKGRKARDWTSPEGGLWASVILDPEVSQIHRGLIPLAVGCACIEAVEDLGGQAQLKWPNDLMVGDDKLGGILVEGRTEGIQLRQAVAGIGINVTNRPPVAHAARLADQVPEATPGALLARILHRLGPYEAWLTQGKAKEICARFMRFAWGIDRELLLDGEPCRPKEIAIDGALIVQRPGEKIEVVRSGSLTVPEAPT